MSAETVVIEDDDIDMEPVIILDEDDDMTNITRMKTVSPVNTIDIDDEFPVANGVEAQNKQGDETKILSKKAEETFIINLKNNRMMDKIISFCLNMEQSVGMPRVINKTLLPLYRDINNKYKETIEFTRLLKKTYKSLVKDPDHKFLHIKTLCEELKSGGLRRKVPFVTLTTDLKNNGVHVNETEIESSSRVIEDEQQKHVKHISCIKNKSKRAKFNTYEYKKSLQSKKRRGVKKKTALDVKYALNTDSMITGRNPNLGEENTDVIDLDNSDKESEIRMDIDDGSNYISVTQEKENNSKGDSNKNDNESKVIEKTEHSNINDVTEKSKDLLENCNNGRTIEGTETETQDSNKENKKRGNENSESSEDVDYDLLIPKKIIEVVIEKTDISTASVNSKVAQLEEQIACYKNAIAELEEAEVSTDSGFSSPYIQCAKLKKEIVLLYKKLFEIKGYSEDIVKRREKIRLHVAKGHPPGPAKKLEQFLNSTIDSTGTVVFPDFDDVVKCVFDADISEKLGWDKQRIFREAAGLFRQCGQALRKRRQKREYKDLLSLVKDKELTETDPADADPVLLAKLEENKRIAKVKENRILERYVNIQEEVVDNGQVYNRVEFQSDHESSGSDSDTQQHQQPTIISTAVHNEECSDACNIINNNLHVRLAHSTNNTISTTVNNIINTTEMRESSNNSNTVCNNNSMYLTPGNVTVNNQNHLVESSKYNNDFSYFYVMSTNNMITTAKRIPEECLNNHVTSNNNVCIPSTDVSNIQTSSATVNNCEMSLENNIVEKNPVDGPRTVSIQTENSCPSNDSAQKQEVSTDEIEPKCELEIKKEPDDIQSMLDELGDNFVCTVFDIEDPFLVIEISSDGFSDDD